MKNLINNNERIFQIVISTGTQVFCNLKDLYKCLHELQAVEGVGSQYKETAIKTLVNAGLLPNLTGSQMYDYLDNNHIEVRASIIRDCKKSELKQ